jgi:hypothetical protein
LEWTKSQVIQIALCFQEQFIALKGTAGDAPGDSRVFVRALWNEGLESFLPELKPGVAVKCRYSSARVMTSVIHSFPLLTHFLYLLDIFCRIVSRSGYCTSVNSTTMSDDEVDLELLALLRQSLGIKDKTDEISRDTGEWKQ